MTRHDSGFDLEGCTRARRPGRYTGWARTYERITGDLCKCARRDAGHVDRTGVRVLVTGRATEEVRSKKTRALLSSGIECVAWARDGRLSPRMDSWDTAGAMSNHGNCACAGMLLLPHGPLTSI